MNDNLHKLVICDFFWVGGELNSGFFCYYFKLYKVFKQVKMDLLCTLLQVILRNIRGRC